MNSDPNEKLEGMVDITDKPPVFRRASACGRIRLQESTIEAIRSGRVKKGDVLATARLAAILAVKDTPRLIPMCHPIAITGLEVSFELSERRIEAAGHCDIGGKDRGGDGGSGRGLGSAAQCLGYGQVPGEG